MVNVGKYTIYGSFGNECMVYLHIFTYIWLKCMVYLLYTFTINLSHSWIGKYTSPRLSVPGSGIQKKNPSPSTVLPKEWKSDLS